MVGVGGVLVEEVAVWIGVGGLLWTHTCNRGGPQHFILSSFGGCQHSHLVDVEVGVMVVEAGGGGEVDMEPPSTTSSPAARPSSSAALLLLPGRINSILVPPSVASSSISSFSSVLPPSPKKTSLDLFRPIVRSSPRFFSMNTASCVQHK